MDELRQAKAANTAQYLKRDEIYTIPSISRVQLKSVFFSEHCLIMALHHDRFWRHAQQQVTGRTLGREEIRCSG